MVLTIIFVSLAIIAFELILVFKFKVFRKINEHSWGAGFVLSLLLGQVVGMMFGLTGAIVGVASVVAMVATDSVYGLRRKIFKTSKTGVNKANETLEDFVAVMSVVGKVAKIGAIVVFSPIILAMKVRRWFVNASPTAVPSAV